LFVSGCRTRWRVGRLNIVFSEVMCPTLIIREILTSCYKVTLCHSLGRCNLTVAAGNVCGAQCGFCEKGHTIVKTALL